jgi:hypothetical protein
VLLRMPLLLRESVKINSVARAILREDGKDPSTLLGFLVWDQAVRAMAKDPSEGPQCIAGVLGQGPRSLMV